MEDPYTPFCGVPPVPAELWTRWLFDPVTLAGLVVLAVALIRSAKDRRAAAAGWMLVALLFISPICAASMALFSARVAQHLLLTLVAAPLLARAAPAPFRAVLPAAGIFAALFWLWHAPAPYAATLTSDVTYWMMHLSLLGAAWVFWSAIIGSVTSRQGSVLLGMAFTAGQMTLLSALLVLAEAPWHPWHNLTAVPYGISAAADQQLAGAIMWVAGGMLVMGTVALLARAVLRSAQTRDLTASRSA